MNPEWTDEEIFMELQDVIADAWSGRADKHVCPKCNKKTLGSEVDEGFIKLQCENCGFFFEGRLG